MGYIHDTNMQSFITSMDTGLYGGTWGNVADGDNWYRQRTAGAGTFYVNVPVNVPIQNSTAKRGCKVASIEVYYSMYDDPLTTLEARVWMQALPASGAFAAPVAVTFTYDSNHDSNAKRITEAAHVMTITLDEPVWVDGSENLSVWLVGAAGAAGNFRIWGARINYTMRV